MTHDSDPFVRAIRSAQQPITQTPNITIVNVPNKPYLVDRARLEAAMGVWHGDGDTEYFKRCRWFYRPEGTVILFTRDAGMHTSGWFKNPDYDKCYHLSISFVDETTQSPRDPEPGEAEVWVKLFFQDNTSYIWTESAYSAFGKESKTTHYRVMVNDHWEPIIPRGEVYSKEFTEHGWLSYSDVQDRTGS